MIVTLMGKGKHMGLPQILPKDLEFGKYYVVAIKTMDDEGVETWNHDMLFISQLTAGNPKKVLVFLKTQSKCTISQLGDPAMFFGPVNVDMDLSNKPKPEPKSSIGVHLDPGSEAIGDYTWTNGDASVHKDE